MCCSSSAISRRPDDPRVSTQRDAADFPRTDDIKGVPMVTVRESFGQRLKIQYVHSPSDIDWDFPLQDQLEPQFYGGPDSKKSEDELRVLRNRIPKLDEQGYLSRRRSVYHLRCPEDPCQALHLICRKQRLGSSMRLIGSTLSNSR